MKKLSEFIRKIKKSPIISFLYENIEQYIVDNDIENMSNEDVENYLKFTFENLYDKFGQMIDTSYEDYQKRLYESILKSYSYEKLIDKLYKYYDSEIIDIVDEDSASETHKLKITIKTDITNDIEFKSLLNLMNYYVKYKSISNISNNHTIIIEPYKPTKITNKIYDKFNGVVYHLTSKKSYENIIKKGGLIPHKIDFHTFGFKSKTEHRYRPHLLYFFYCNDNVLQFANEIKKQINHNDEDKLVLLKINLNKYQYKVNIYADPANSKEMNACYTYEFIPKKCIEDIKYV